MSTVSQLLHDVHDIAIRPGGRGECPFCHHTTFSVKDDDSLGKCFHPACSRFWTLGRENGQYRYSLARVLEGIYQDCHQELLRLASEQQNAYTYLRDERGIHPQVIADAMLGAVPSGFDIGSHFQPVITEVETTLATLESQKRGRPTRQLAQAESDSTTCRTPNRSWCTAWLIVLAGWCFFTRTRLTALLPCACASPTANNLSLSSPGAPACSAANSSRRVSAQPIKPSMTFCWWSRGNSTRYNSSLSRSAMRKPQGRRWAM